MSHVSNKYTHYWDANVSTPVPVDSERVSVTAEDEGVSLVNLDDAKNREHSVGAMR